MTRTQLVAVVLVVLLLVAVAVLALRPLPTADLQSVARPSRSYEDAVAEIAAKRRSEEGHIAAEGGSILLTHGTRTPVAVVLFHGYTNSPVQFDSLARMLYAGGYNVYVPLLPDHAQAAEMPAALTHLTAVQLKAAADSAVDLAHGLGDTVVVGGLSLGGTMAAWVAQSRADVARVVIIAPVLGLARVPGALATPLMNSWVRLPQFIGRIKVDPEEPDRETGWSTHTLGEILRLGFATRQAAAKAPPAVTSIGILLNDHDRTIATAPVMELAGHWSDHGAKVDIRHISPALGLPHDVIDPRQRIRRPDIVYPILIDLLKPVPP